MPCASRRVPRTPGRGWARTLLPCHQDQFRITALLSRFQVPCLLPLGVCAGLRIPGDVPGSAGRQSRWVSTGTQARVQCCSGLAARGPQGHLATGVGCGLPASCKCHLCPGCKTGLWPADCTEVPSVALSTACGLGVRARRAVYSVLTPLPGALPCQGGQLWPSTNSWEQSRAPTQQTQGNHLSREENLEGRNRLHCPTQPCWSQDQEDQLMDWVLGQ